MDWLHFSIKKRRTGRDRVDWLSVQQLRLRLRQRHKFRRQHPYYNAALDFARSPQHQGVLK